MLVHSSLRKARGSRSVQAGLLAIAACVACDTQSDAGKPTVKNPAGGECTLTSDCPAGGGQICIFSRCSPACVTDADCTVANTRCLHTNDGTACVATKQACEGSGVDTGDASVSCPSGTTCINSGCYGTCSGDLPCADGHACESGVCTGSVPDAGGGGASGAPGGSNGGATTGEAGAAGESGGAGSSLCGDGMLDGREGCDDGNLDPDDGCSASCVVEAGYTCDTEQSPSICTDVNECQNGTNDCSANARCTNTNGSFTCACKGNFVGDGVTCSPQPSCVGLGANCGNSANDNCCASPLVAGGSFNLSNNAAYSAIVATFALDKYEVTVGRFRKFVAAYAGPPAVGAGAHPLIADSGWQSTWNSFVDASASDLALAVQCDAKYQTWNAAGTNDRLPMNCVSWYEAFAFCAWDGGRLPTEAEWEYAAAGGSSELKYPWGNSPVPSNLPDSTTAYANYYGFGDGSALGVYAFSDILPVGSKPAGVGKFGQLDLAGSVDEWALDFYGPYSSSCDNCAALSSGQVTALRVLRGGDWENDASFLLAASRSYLGPVGYSDLTTGFRCARAP